MYGERERGRAGQLALMDAMVFFALTMLICSVQLLQLHRELSADDSLDLAEGRRNPLGLLRAFLGTSIGCRMTLDMVPEVVVRPETKVADCLVTEAICLIDGGAASVFDEMNRALLAIVANASARFALSCLCVDSSTEGVGSRLLTLGHCDEASGGNSYAASSELMTYGSSRITVTLVLFPALLPEALGV